MRLGFKKFNLLDFDEFACKNTNRQVSATIKSYYYKKLDTMIAMAKSINLNVDIRTFPEGIDEKNTDDFLIDVDCYIDIIIKNIENWFAQQ